MNRSCEPGIKGCVLFGKVKRLLPDLNDHTPDATNPDSSPSPPQLSRDKP
ncbi:MAG: hypothetical protein HYX94_06585 [Chloroflexi bacterium]|nr:hypothetical protein [Chloroflexota bacterium]